MPALMRTWFAESFLTSRNAKNPHCKITIDYCFHQGKTYVFEFILAILFR